MRKIFWIFAFLSLVGLAIPEMPAIGVDSAYAQAKKKKRKNLFELLFKHRRRAEKPARANNKKSVRRNIRTRKSKRNATRKVAAKPVVPKVEKSENAAKILVVGDFIADGTAWGLERVFASETDVVIVNKSSGLSGIVRDDVVDWPARIPELIEENKPIAIVVVVGMNDRQQMRTSAGKFNKLTDEWKAQYVARSKAIAQAAAATKLVWLGLPPVNKNSMNTDYLLFNEIYRTAAEGVGGSFVDVWDGYTNAEGKFITAGPDINGQIVRLRNSDGINMTKAGRRKLAFYAEKAIRKVTGIGTGELLASLPDVNLPAQTLQPEYDPAKTGRTIVVSLDGPALDGGTVLEGGDDFLKSKDGDKSVSHELVAKGQAAVPHKGRIDAGWGLAKPAPKPEESAAKKEDDAKTSASTSNAQSPATAKPEDASAVEKKPLPTVTEIKN